MAVSSLVLNSSLDSSSSSTLSIKEGESPKNRSSSFSISAILSDEVGGQRRSPLWPLSTPTNERGRPINTTSSEQVNLQTPKRPKDSDSQRDGVLRRPQLTLTEAANLMTPVSDSTLQVHHPIASVGSHTMTTVGGATPPLHPSRNHNSSLTASPFDPSFLHALGQQTSPTDKEDLLSDSLGMLSTVAMYHSELSSTLGTPVQNRLADIRITSSCDGSDRSSDWNGVDPVINVSQRPLNKSRTPSILKRRQRKASVVSTSDSCQSGDESVSSRHDRLNHTYLNTGFLSPLANDKSALQQSGFSPSIFLSRPDQSTMLKTPPNNDDRKIRPSPLSDSENNQEAGANFTTSTPIKGDKENAQKRKPGWSPNILRGGRRNLLRETNESSSGSDTEQPVKRPLTSPLTPPKKRRRKSKARTKLSPLLENACSPILKADHAPSPLTLTLSTTPTRPQAPPHTNTAAIPVDVPTTSQLIPQSIFPSQSTQLPDVSENVATTTMGSNSQPFTSHEFLRHPTSTFFNPSPLSMGQITMPRTQPRAIIPQFQPVFQNPSHNLSYPLNPLLSTTSSVLGQNTLHQPYPHPILSPTQQYPRPLISPPLGLPQQSVGNPYMSVPYCIPQSHGGFVQLQVMPNYGTLGNTSNFVATGNTVPNAATLPGNVTQGNPLSLFGNQNMSNGTYTQKRDDKIKSVPPWFIFSDKRPEGKRSRLTEAINKSLSETPSENTKLPVEWTKYACGQTNDQKDLTEKARSFILNCRPRTLNFEEDSN